MSPCALTLGFLKNIHNLPTFTHTYTILNNTIPSCLPISIPISHSYPRPAFAPFCFTICALPFYCALLLCPVLGKVRWGRSGTGHYWSRLICPDADNSIGKVQFASTDSNVSSQYSSDLRAAWNIAQDKFSIGIFVNWKKRGTGQLTSINPFLWPPTVSTRENELSMTTAHLCICTAVKRTNIMLDCGQLTFLVLKHEAVAFQGSYEVVK